jgi:hypothetical protein
MATTRANDSDDTDATTSDYVVNTATVKLSKHSFFEHHGDVPSSKKEVLVGGGDVPIFPLENKSSSDFLAIKKMARKTYHEVSKVKLHDREEGLLRNFYFKANQTSGEPLLDYTSELEAVCGGWYGFIANGYTPATYAVYDEGKRYIGVLSEEILDFKPLSADSLKQDDLDISFFYKLANNFSLLDQIDNQIRKLRIKIEKLNQRIQSLSQQEEAVRQKVLKLSMGMSDADILTKLESATKKTQDLSAKKTASLIDLAQTTKQMVEYYHTLEVDHGLSRNDVEKYKMLKGLGISLAASFIMMEDDLHQNNMSKYGIHIDFDMSWWIFGYKVVNKGVFVTCWRKPDECLLSVTESDDDWPAHPMKNVPEAVIDTIKNFVPVSTNNYPQLVNTIYQQLENNPIFKHYAFATFLKYSLTNADIYKKIAKLHIRADRGFKDRSIINIFGDDHTVRIRNFEKALSKLPQFAEYFQLHGRAVYEKLLADLVERNDAFVQKRLNAQKAHEVVSKAINSTLQATEEDLKPAKIKVNQLKAVCDACNEQMIDLEQVKIAFEDMVSTIAINFNKDKEAVIAAGMEVVQPGEYLKVQAIVVAELTTYKKGYYRHHGKLADEIIIFCNEQKPEANDVDANVVAISELRCQLDDKFKNLIVKSGSMYDALSKLINDATLWELVKVYAPPSCMP